MLSLILAASLVTADKPQIPGDLRTFCTNGGVIEQQSAKGGKSGTMISVSSRKQRVVTLPGGHHLMVQHTKEGNDELLVEEDGKYRRIVSGRSKIQHLAPSEDGKHVAVIVVHDDKPSMFNVPNAGLYLFDTATWQGEQIVKLFGYSGIAWSPDSKKFAYGDYSKVRVFDLAAGGQLETCGVDSASSDDGKERVMDLGWLSDKKLRFTYQNPRGKTDFVVGLP